MVVFSEDITIETNGEVHLVDITQNVQQVVTASGVANGLLCVFVPGSTGTLTTIEYEPGLQKDLPLALERIAPKDHYYHHQETWRDDNGHSHIRASLMGPSITIPIRKGTVVHGTWQQLVFIELDTRPRSRTLVVQVIGE